MREFTVQLATHRHASALPGSRPSQDCTAFSGDRRTGFTDRPLSGWIALSQSIGWTDSTVSTGRIDWNDESALCPGVQSETAYLRDRTLLFRHDGDK